MVLPHIIGADDEVSVPVVAVPMSFGDQFVPYSNNPAPVPIVRASCFGAFLETFCFDSSFRDCDNDCVEKEESTKHPQSPQRRQHEKTSEKSPNEQKVQKVVHATSVIAYTSTRYFVSCLKPDRRDALDAFSVEGYQRRAVFTAFVCEQKGRTAYLVQVTRPPLRIEKTLQISLLKTQQTPQLTPATDPVFTERRNKRKEMEAGTSSILARIGGESALDAAVAEFYFRLVCDDNLIPFFDGVDIEGLKRHQRQFLILAFTDKVPPNVCSLLMEAHSRLIAEGLSEVHFDMVAGHLVETLYSLGIKEDLVNEIVAIVAPLRAVFLKSAGTQKTLPAEEKNSGVDLEVESCVMKDSTNRGCSEGEKPSRAKRCGNIWRKLFRRPLAKVV